MDRPKLFKDWLVDLTPEKLETLVEFEKSVRKVIDMTALGFPDKMLYDKMREASDKLRKSYENDKKVG